LGINKRVNFSGTELTQNIHQACHVRGGKKAEAIEWTQLAENKSTDFPKMKRKLY
jgi:hypothetical protein